MRRITRRELLKFGAIMVVGVIAGCAPKVVEVTREVEKEVTKVVKETVVIEGQLKEVTKVVKETVVVEKAPEQVTINFAHCWSFATQDFEALFARMKDEYPHISVDIEMIPPAQYADTLKTRYMGGSGPDVIFLWQPTVVEWHKLGLVLDITESMKEGWGDWIAKESRQGMQVDGRDIMIPLRVTTLGIYYNKSIFEEVGLQPFTKYSDFTAACEAIKEKTEHTPLATAGATQSWIFDLWFKIQNLTDDEEQQLYNCKVGYADLPGVRKTWEMWYDLMNSGWIPEGYFGMDYEPARALFFQGKAAMSLDGSWMLKDYRKGAELSGFQYGIMPMPQINDSIPAKAVWNVDAIMAFSGTEYPNEATDVLKFITTPDTQKYLAETWLNISLVEGVEYTDPDVAIFASFLDGDKAWYGTSGVWATTPELGSAESENWESVAKGRVSIDDAINHVQEVMGEHCPK